MQLFQKIIALFTSLIMTIFGVSGVTLSQKAQSLRVVAYIVAYDADYMRNLDNSHFDHLTDIILIGNLVFFDEEGQLSYNDYFADVVAAAKDKIGDRPIRLHMNVAGPAGPGETYEEQLYSGGDAHTKAFRSGRMEAQLLEMLQTYGLDGVFFDYEFPMTDEHLAAYDDFIVSLKKTIGDDYILGVASPHWGQRLSRAAIRALDMVEVMCYDCWDENGVHSSVKATKSYMKGYLHDGYRASQLDMGIPFYARPSSGEAYWYSYAGYYQDLDESGVMKDPATGLTFNFNTPETVYEKTSWAIQKGLGGVMVWNYGCDLPADNDASLFNAVARAKQDAAGRTC